MESGGSPSRTTGGAVTPTSGWMGATAESGSSSTRTADRTVIRMGPVPPLPVVPSRKRILDRSHRPDGGVTIKPLLADSKHRDGSILRESCSWHKMYRMNITDETSVEPMMMSKKPNCQPYSRDCQMHGYCNMMQIYWLKLAYISVDSFYGPVQVYGFLAARDILNPRRNYLFNRGRDDPLEIVQDDDWLNKCLAPREALK
ncbi:uncharacterized protein [Triticum aestivum]|uniref:uncharacterized protein n=1 Tax=Triticum aestivum TaxID=4565 RepID=UPI001D00B3B9|nr:uncharacterized protein LOC123185941 [Triticum aestivum]